jgi:hypothetical protein
MFSMVLVMLFSVTKSGGWLGSGRLTARLVFAVADFCRPADGFAFALVAFFGAGFFAGAFLVVAFLVAGFFFVAMILLSSTILWIVLSFGQLVYF